MSIAAKLLCDFEVQPPVTRRFLERLPEDKLSWKPHHKSMTAGQLAYHLALVPGGVVTGAKEESIAPPSFQFSQPESHEEILNAYGDSVATVRNLMPTFDNVSMAATWRIKHGDKELVAVPRESLSAWRYVQPLVPASRTTYPLPARSGPARPSNLGSQRRQITVLKTTRHRSVLNRIVVSKRTWAASKP